MVEAVSGVASDERLVQAVRTSVEQELQRLGRLDALRIEGAWLIFGKGATETRAEVQGTFEDWQELPEDLRERRSRQIAALLAIRPASAPVAPRPQKLSNRPGWLSAIAPVLIVAATALALVLAYKWLSPHSSNTWPSLSRLHSPSTIATAPFNLASAPEPERSALAGKACDRVRSRIARGANIGPADVEGWQVELVLLRRGPRVDLSQAPALHSFLHPKSSSLAASTWLWPKAKSLILAQRYDAQVEVYSLPALGSAQLSGVRFVFSGPYVTPYFSEELRSDYLLLADALADALSATDGALFARCANANEHAVGSWFLGVNPGAAMGSLVYFMSGSSEAAVLKPEVLGNGSEAQRNDHLFDSISRATKGIDRDSSATLLGRELGMISGRPNKPSRLTFPFRDANRAQRSSRQVAQALGLANAL